MSNDAFVTTKFLGSEASDTGGWDTVYALKVGVVNDAIAEHFAKSGDMGSRLTFDATMAPTIKMGGRFGPWQITTGGSGQQIRLCVPIISGEAILDGAGLSISKVDLSGGHIVVQVALGFHPVYDTHEEALKAAMKVKTKDGIASSGSANDIRSGATIANGSGGDVGKGIPTASDNLPVTIVAVYLPEGNVPADDLDVVTTFIQSLAKIWFKNNLDIFDYVFLSVDVAETAANGAWDWIKPTYVGYAVTDLLDEHGAPLPIENSIIAIMSLTEGRLPGKQKDGSVIAVSPSVSIAAIPANPGVNAGFLIKPDLLLKKIIARNMPNLFENADETSFIVSSDSLTISNAKPLNLTLEMDPKWWSFSDKVAATIKPGNLSVAFTQTGVQQTFSNISFPCGHDDELTIDISLASHSTMGIDGSGRFAMQYGGDTISTLSVQPDSSKLASEALKGFGLNLGLTILLCMIPFGGAAREAEGTVAKVSTVVEDLPAAETALVDKAAATLEQAVVDGKAVSSTVAAPATEAMVGATRGVEGTIAELKTPSVWSFKGIVSRMTFKVWAMFVGQFAGQLYQEWSNLDMIEAYDRHPQDMPTLRNFLDDCVKPAIWTNTGEQVLACAGLNGAFVMGFSVPRLSTQDKT